jgi:hypothetical protein
MVELKELSVFTICSPIRVLRVVWSIIVFFGVKGLVVALLEFYGVSPGPFGGVK